MNIERPTPNENKEREYGDAFGLTIVFHRPSTIFWTYPGTIFRSYGAGGVNFALTDVNLTG